MRAPSYPTIAARPAVSDRDGITLTGFVASRASLLCGHDHVRVVGEDDRLRGTRAVDPVQDLVGRRVHGLAALDERGRAEALEEPAISVTGDDGHDVGRPLDVGRLAQSLLTLRRLDVHVRDLDAFEHAERSPGPQGGARIVRVHVHLERRGVADDEEGVAEPHELALQGVRVEALALHDVDRAVAIARGLQVDRVDAQGLGGGSFGKRFAPDVRGDAADDLDQPGGSRVHDACLTEDFELLLRLCDGLVSSDDEGGQEVLEALPVPGLRFLRQGADRRQHRPLHGLAHGLVRRIRRRAECPGDGRGVDLFHRTQNVPGAADDLGQDHARVPARSEQRGPRDVGVAALERLDHRPGREEHVRPGVAVGHRIDVQVVDSCAVGLESGLGGTREVEH